ncbi:MAG: LysR family transcriptional regulator [Deltaproteobacteria bacterium]|nr:LysR family transcriptional regulator [Deltaproteobacteria bacterium]MCB9788789.1 LysR family transcriptional regulator [Deltaproteobacteria bacterium]
MGDADPLNLHHLRYFYEIARTGSMKRAAERLGVSQPALSKQTSALEDALGFPLFHRSPKGMELTPDGERIFAHSERMFGHLRDLEEDVESLRSGSAGRLAVATVNSIGVHILPDYLRRFRDEHPAVRLRLVTCRSARVIDALREHRVDVGLVAGWPDAEGMIAHRFVSNPLRVVVGVDHPVGALEQSGPLPPEVLEGHALVTFDEEAPTRRLATAALRALGLEPEVVAESQDIEVIKRLVAIGLGFAVLPAHCIGRELATGELRAVAIDGFDLQRDLYVVRRMRGGLPAAAEQFLALFNGG